MLEVANGLVIKWWIDASFAVHPDMRSPSRATMSLGLSQKQKINTKSSTEAEVVGVDDAMPLVVWTRNFMQEQGFTVQDNIVYQDNQSTMQLEKNGKISSGCRTRHIGMPYFFITDQIKHGEVRIEHCQTDGMIGDFFTKPLQGSKFQKFQQLILSKPPDVDLCNQPAPQECVGKCSYADVVWTGLARDPMRSSKPDLVKKRLNLEEIPSPVGGCRLTSEDVALPFTNFNG